MQKRNGVSNRLKRERLLLMVGLCIIGHGAVAADLKSRDPAVQQIIRKAQGVVRQISEEKAALEAEKASLIADKAQLEAQVKLLQRSLTKQALMASELAHCKSANAVLANSKGSLETELTRCNTTKQTVLEGQRKTLEDTRNTESNNHLLVSAVKEREAWIEQCSLRNKRLIADAQTLTEKYRDKGFWQALGDVEPLTGIGEVRTDTIAEQYRYQLHQLKVTPFQNASEQPGPAEVTPASATTEASDPEEDDEP